VDTALPILACVQITNVSVVSWSSSLLLPILSSSLDNHRTASVNTEYINVNLEGLIQCTITASMAKLDYN
jgi:hypothetical protein